MGEISKKTSEVFAHPHEVKSTISLDEIDSEDEVEGMFQDAEEITLTIEVRRSLHIQGKGDPIIKTIALDEIDSEFEVIGIENGEAKIKFSLRGSYSMFIGENWNLKFKVT